MADKNKNIVGFKKFSDLKNPRKNEKKEIEDFELSSGIEPENDNDIPMNPNIPNNSSKRERPVNTDKLKPQPESDDDFDDDESDVSEKVETFGKVAKFPKNVKASKAYNFLENVKVSKKSIWYIMVEKQDNELQMVKYNYKEGVDLSKFVNELKGYYIKKYNNQDNICKLIENIKVDGTDKYSMVKNIPLIEIDGKKLITKITEDLIKLLSK